MIHVDWLSIYEDHAADVPVHAAEIGVWCDPVSGEILRESTRGVVHRGSFSSSVHIRSRGSRVEVSGNPSKWGKPDALFGLASVDQAIAVYNRILIDLGLPPFSVGASYPQAPETVSDRHGSSRVSPSGFLQSSDAVSYVGPRITRVDLTENFSVGRGAVSAYQSWLTTQSLQIPGPRRLGRMPFPGTVTFGGSAARTQTVCYEKGPELRAHIGDITRRMDPAEREETREYLGRLADWCDSQGVVRWEVRFGRKWLGECGAFRPEWWYGRDLEKVVDNFRVLGHEGATVIDWRNDLENELVADGVTERQAGRIRDAVLAWLSGAGIPAGISDRTWRRYAQLVRPYGINLLAAPNVVALPVRVRDVSVASVSPPAFYCQRVA